MKLIVWALFILPPFVTRAEGAVETAKFVLCRSQKIVRTIRVDKGGDGCETVYTKAGVDRIVGTGRNVSSCENVLNNIRGNLEEAHWNCKDVNSAAVSDLSD